MKLKGKGKLFRVKLWKQLQIFYINGNVKGNKIIIRLFE